MLAVEPTVFEVITRLLPLRVACAPPAAVADMPAVTIAAWISVSARAVPAAAVVRRMSGDQVPPPLTLILKLAGVMPQALAPERSPGPVKRAAPTAPRS